MKTFALTLFLIGWPIAAGYTFRTAWNAAGMGHCGSWQKLDLKVRHARESAFDFFTPARDDNPMLPPKR